MFGKSRRVAVICSTFETFFECSRNFEPKIQLYRLSHFPYSDLIFNARGIEEWLDFLPQFPPWPGAELEVSAQWALDDGEGQALFLQFLEGLTGEVTASPWLHPGHDAGKTFVTEFFHLTQDTSTEEDLFREVRGTKLKRRTLKRVSVLAR